jgi:hypothetical protein
VQVNLDHIGLNLSYWTETSRAVIGFHFSPFVISKSTHGPTNRLFRTSGPKPIHPLAQPSPRPRGGMQATDDL